MNRTILPIATFKEFDKLATILSMKRKRYFWLFKESDKRYQDRILDELYRGKFRHISMEGKYIGEN